MTNQPRRGAPTRRGKYTKQIQASSDAEMPSLDDLLNAAVKLGEGELERVVGPIADERLRTVIVAKYIYDFADRLAWENVAEIYLRLPPYGDTDAAPADAARALGISTANIDRWIDTRTVRYAGKREAVGKMTHEINTAEELRAAGEGIQQQRLERDRQSREGKK